MVRLQPLGKTVSIVTAWSLCARVLMEHNAQQAAELGEALRSLGLVITQKELSDMKADRRGANWMHVIVSQDMCGRCPSLSGRGWK